VGLLPRAYVQKHSALAAALALLEEWGLLLLQDPKLPSVATLYADETIRGSWWGHPRGQEIFHAMGALDDHPDVLPTKLLSGKVTFVHRRLWQLVIATGQARDEWQLRGLSPEARDLLSRIDKAGRVEASGPAAKELELALLAASRQVHTDSGAHATELWTWATFAKTAKVSVPELDSSEARRQLEGLVHALNEKFGGSCRLPWEERK
jgi:hypothetical protein